MIENNETTEERVWEKVEQLTAALPDYVIRENEQLTSAKMLCSSCNSGIVFQRKAKDLTDVFEVFCQTMQDQVPPDIHKCSGYRKHHQLDLNDMVRIAIPIDKRIGINDGSYR